MEFSPASKFRPFCVREALGGWVRIILSHYWKSCRAIQPVLGNVSRSHLCPLQVKAVTASTMATTVSPIVVVASSWTPKGP